MKLVIVRIVTLLTAAIVTSGLLAFFTQVEYTLALAVPYSALYFIPVNIYCFHLVRRAVHEQGGRVRDFVCYERKRIGPDLLLALGLQLLLFIPFMLTLLITLLTTTNFIPIGEAFELAFTPPADTLVEPPQSLILVGAIVAALFFPITNAPTEEVIYRGYAQTRLLAAGWPRLTALLVPSLAFGAQHVLLAPTAVGMTAYAIAFSAWGLCAALLYWRLGRLLPLIIAHFLTNSITAAIPLILLSEL